MGKYFGPILNIKFRPVPFGLGQHPAKSGMDDVPELLFRISGENEEICSNKDFLNSTLIDRVETRRASEQKMS